MGKAILIVALAAALCGCAGAPEYYDTNAAVDRNVLCASRPDHPNTPVSKECERVTGVRWARDAKGGEPVDLSGAKPGTQDD